MNIILNNPYRTVGLLVGATPREQVRNINRLKKYIEAEQDPQDDFSFPALGDFHRTIASVEDAESKLNLNYDKINAALFWFWNGNSITDEVAFEALKNGDIETANSIWDKLIIKTDENNKRIWKPVTEKNHSAFHNYSVLNIAIQSKSNYYTGVLAGIYFLESDLIHNFASSVTDETYKTNKRELQLLFLNQIILDIEATKKSTVSKFLEILNDREFIAKQDFSNGIIQNQIEQIENKIETAKNRRKANKANAAQAGQELFKSTSADLTHLISIVGLTDSKYTSIADKIANEIIQCSIDYFNHNHENNRSSEYIETALKLAKQAELLAFGKIIKDRVNDSIYTLYEIKDKELSEALKALKAIKQSYEKNKVEIKERVMMMPLGNNQSINWTKVDEMIENSINWNKVVELIKRVIPPQNIDKIKCNNNPTKLNEYKNLVEFVMSKLNYLQKNKVKYIVYWKSPIKISIPTAGDIEKIHKWIKWIIGIIIFSILLRACD